MCEWQILEWQINVYPWRGKGRALGPVSSEMSAPALEHLDHLVLTVTNLERTCAFYREALGMEVVVFGQGRKALRFGRQKINLHEAGFEFEPKAARPTPGSADLCLLTSGRLDEWLAHFRLSGVPVLEGPVRRTGALGPIESLYLRDPDGNLIEIATPLASDTSLAGEADSPRSTA